MATPKTVTGKIQDASGNPRSGKPVTAILSQSCTIPGTQETPPVAVSTTTGPDGSWSLPLYATNDLTPNGTYYEVFEDGMVLTIQVPQTAGPFVVSNITTSTPTASPSPNHVSTLTVDGATTLTAGPVVVGTDPGGAQTVRVGGTAHVSGAVTLDSTLGVTGLTTVNNVRVAGQLDEDGVIEDLQYSGQVSPYAFNAAAPLTTPTYDLSGQATEPSLVYIPGGWNSWKYWLAFCPYPGADATKENPSILVSNDGQTWQVPNGLTNPVVAKPASGTNFDSTLFFDRTTGTMYLYWADTVGTGNVWSLQSTDGITWTNKTNHFSNLGASSWNTPQVVWDGTQYNFFYVDLNGTITVRKATGASPLGPWSAAQASNVAGAVLNGNNGSHAEVRFFGGKFYMVINANANGFLFWLSSPDGLTWALPDRPLMIAGSGTWDANLYKTAFALVQAAEGWLVQLWYSAFNASNVYHIGFTQVPLRSGVFNQGGGTLQTGQVRSSLKTGVNDHAFVASPNSNNTDSIYAGFGIINHAETIWLTRFNKDGTGNVGSTLTVGGQTSTTSGGSTTGFLNFGSASALGIYFGSGIPTISAPQGSLYLRTDGSSTSTRAYINTNGSTTWTAITTVA